MYVERSSPQAGKAAQLEQLTRQVAAAGPDTDCIALFAAVCRLRREILFSHPALDFPRLLINKHAPGAYSHNCDQYLGRHSRPGEGLVVLENWQSSPRETRLLGDKMLRGDTAHPTLSFDARRVVFGFCNHAIGDRGFFIYEAATDGSFVRQLTGTEKDPMEGAGGRKTVKIEDFDPCYLPGGGIVFTSTRSQCFGRCHGGRYTPSYLLYRADADGGNIRPISFGEANEHFPSILNDGRVVFTRWEYINRNQIALHKLWWCRPDGTEISNFYGSNSATPWAKNYSDYGREQKWYAHMSEEARKRVLPFLISETRAIPGSRKVVATAGAHHSYTAGCLVIIDPDLGEDGFEPLSKLTPETPFPEPEDWFEAPGNYMTPYPVNGELFFAGYSPYYIPNQGKLVPQNDYMVYLVDTLGGREPIYTDPAISCVSPMPLLPRKEPPVIPSILPKEPPADKTGTLVLQNVYLTGNDPEKKIKPGSIRHLRIFQILNLPQNGHPWCGSREDFARKILGTVPVNPDGSVKFKVPAGIPIHLQALDENRMALLTERSLFHVMPGEVRSCVGCHEPVGTAPQIRSSAMRQQEALTITPPPGPQYEGGFSFKRSVQPVLDRYCIGCHGLGKELPGKINLLGSYGRTDDRSLRMPPFGFNNGDSYRSLTTKEGLVKLALRKSNGGPDSETVNSRPGDYFAHASKLAPMLLAGHPDSDGKKRVELDRVSLYRIVQWLDTNCIRYGDFSPRSKVEWRRLSGNGEKALRAFVEERFGSEIAAQPIQALVNVAQVDESRILMAPLPLSSGGWGQIEKGYKSKNDPDYRKMREIILDKGQK